MTDMEIHEKLFRKIFTFKIMPIIMIYLHPAAVVLLKRRWKKLFQHLPISKLSTF